MMSVRDRDTALDLVQEAMIKLAGNYASKPENEWPPLFYRILQNKVRDWQRQQMVRNKVMLGPQTAATQAAQDHAIDHAAHQRNDGPQQMLQQSTAMEKLQHAVAELPQRQREVFLLRSIEELSVADTADALEIGQGSVKTHYSRALAALREKLGDHWP